MRRGHDGWVGVNYLEKIQLATPAAVYGAMLAGVDYVLMGAGVPTGIPQLLGSGPGYLNGPDGADLSGPTSLLAQFAPALHKAVAAAP